MRFVLLSLLLGSPAYAWNATIDEICTLTHETEAEEIRLTYDPAQPLYTLEITRRAEGWTQTPWFAMRFEGPNPIEIGTPRHKLSDDAMSLFVSDTGFGNVLDGLEFNQTAYAFTQDHLSEFSLEGAGPEVRKFRTCAAARLS